jgi:hypothetical protein
MKHPDRSALPLLFVVVDGQDGPGPFRPEWLAAWRAAKPGDPCARCGTPLEEGWCGNECPACVREYDEARGCRCGGTNLCPECQSAGATEATRGVIRCDPTCSTLCAVCCPDD